MNLQDAEKNLALALPKYTIIGVVSDGRKGIPPSYNIDVAVTPETSVFEMMKGFESVRVFEMVEVGDSHDWLKKRNDYFAAKTVKEEKELLQVLKERYESE